MNTTKIVAISDFHGELIPIESLPPGDVLVMAGDIFPDDWMGGEKMVGTTRIDRQGQWFHARFLPYLREAKTRYDHVIFVGGNHCFWLDRVGPAEVRAQLPELVHYLHDSGVRINGLLFWGFGWNLTYGWAFYRTEQEMIEKVLPQIPEDVDVIVSHGPPLHPKLAPVYSSEAFTRWLSIRNSDRHPPAPKAVIFGHIHRGYGQDFLGNIQLFNVAMMNEDYKIVNPPTEFSLTRRDWREDKE